MAAKDFYLNTMTQEVSKSVSPSVAARSSSNLKTTKEEGEEKKTTSNDKNYTSRCTGVGLYKMFRALPEEEKSALRTTCFAPLLLIDPIATMSTLVVEIFDRHLGDMKFQFGETIIQMKPIHVCLILGLRISPIADEFLFVDPEYITNFRIRRFPKKKNAYGLKEIDEALKQAKLERHHDDVLRLNLLKIILSFLLPNKGRNVEVKYVDLVDDIVEFNRFPWGEQVYNFLWRQIVGFVKYRSAVDKKSDKALSLHGCTWVLMIWIFLSIPGLKFPRIHESKHLFPKLQGWRMTSFKRHQIVKFKKFFANPDLLVITMKASETDMQQELVQEAMRNYIEAPTIGGTLVIGAALAIEPPAVSGSSSTTEIGAVVVKKNYIEASEIKVDIDSNFIKGDIEAALCKRMVELQNHSNILERISMSTLGDSTLPLGDSHMLFGQYSTFEKIVKHKREEESDEKEDGKRKKAGLRTWQREVHQKNLKIKEKKKNKREREEVEKLRDETKYIKKTNANKKNKKAEETDVQVEGIKKKTLTNEQLDHAPLIVLKSLIPKGNKRNRGSRKSRATIPNLKSDEIPSTQENLIQQIKVTPEEGVEVEKDLEVDDEIEEVNMNVISSQYGGDLVELQKGAVEEAKEKYDEDEKDDKEKKSKKESNQKDDEEKTKSVQEEEPEGVQEEEAKEMEDAEQITVVVQEVEKKDVVEEANERAEEELQKKISAMERRQKKFEVQMKRMMEGKNQVDNDDEKEAMREELEELRALNQVLIVQQLQDRGALNEAKKALVSSWKDSTDGRSAIGVKLFGALDSKPFLVASYRKYSSSEVAQEKSAQICSLWEKELSNPAWHPFDVIEIHGEHQEVIHDDEKLLKLKKDWGDGAYNAVRTALTELNQYNPSGRYVVPELWNYVEGKKVTLAEAIKVLLKLSKSV